MSLWKVIKCSFKMEILQQITDVSATVQYLRVSGLTYDPLLVCRAERQVICITLLPCQSHFSSFHHCSFSWRYFNNTSYRYTRLVVPVDRHALPPLSDSHFDPNSGRLVSTEAPAVDASTFLINEGRDDRLWRRTQALNPGHELPGNGRLWDTAA